MDGQRVKTSMCYYRGRVQRWSPHREKRPGLLKGGACPCGSLSNPFHQLWGLKKGENTARAEEQGQSSVWRGVSCPFYGLEVREGWGLRSGLEGTGCLCWGGRKKTAPKPRSWPIPSSTLPGLGPGGPPWPPSYHPPWHPDTGSLHDAEGPWSRSFALPSIPASGLPQR